MIKLMSNLYISNLCSDEKNFKQLLNIIIKYKNAIQGLDLAPLNVIKNWQNYEKKSKSIYNLIKKKNLKVNAIQGIFFKKHINLINDFFTNDKEIISHIKKIINICKIFHCKKIIFGSAEFRNRKNHSVKYANLVFVKFIEKIIPLLEEKKITFCIETIPKIYNSDYLYKFYQTCKIVKRFNNKFVKINFDSGIFFNSRFDKNKFIDNLNLISNIQISEPYCNFFTNPTKYNLLFLNVLKKISYKGTISLEIIAKKFEKKKIEKSINNFINFFN